MGYAQLALLEQTLMVEGDSHDQSPTHPSHVPPPSPPRLIGDMQGHHLHCILETSLASMGSMGSPGKSGSGPSGVYTPPMEKHHHQVRPYTRTLPCSYARRLVCLYARMLPCSYDCMLVCVYARMHVPVYLFHHRLPFSSPFPHILSIPCSLLVVESSVQRQLSPSR